jgi:hypothetical protein
MVGCQPAGVFTSWVTDHRQTLGHLAGVIRCVAASLVAAGLAAAGVKAREQLNLAGAIDVYGALGIDT